MRGAGRQSTLYERTEPRCRISDWIKDLHCALAARRREENTGIRFRIGMKNSTAPKGGAALLVLREKRRASRGASLCGYTVFPERGDVQQIKSQPEEILPADLLRRLWKNSA